MGRGPHDHQAVMSAQSLLFGPRRSGQEVPASVQKEKKREMVKIGKKRAKERSKADYARSFTDAGEEAEKGNFAPLAALPESQHGFKGVEKQSLRLLVDQLVEIIGQHAKSTFASDPKLASKLTKGPEDIDAFLALRDKVIAYKMPGKVIFKAQRLITSNACMSANAEASQKLIDQKDAIGPLPEIVAGDDYNRHLLKDGKTVCGRAVFDYSRRRNQPARKSILSADLDCPDCLERQGEGELLEPDQWADLLSQRDLSPWGDYVREFGYRGDKLGDDGAYIISAYQKKSSEQINDNLASVGLDKLL